MPTSPAKGGTTVDPRAQLSSGYWNRVAQTAAVNRAAQPDMTDYDRRMREENDLLSPPGPRDAPAGEAYRRGGAVKKGSGTVPRMCTGGKVISSRNF